MVRISGRLAGAVCGIALLSAPLMPAAIAQEGDTPPPEITYFPNPARPWDTIPAVTIAGRPDDPRIPLVLAAVEFWNQQLQDIGSSFGLGEVADSAELVPDDYLQARSAAILSGQPVPDWPESVTNMPGDLIVALSDASFVSFGGVPGPGRRLIVGISGFEPPRTFPNVMPNVITHELGHSIGLGHNNDPAQLMCGRPAACRPDSFRSDTPRIFPVTDEERATLLRLYPPTWEPSR